MEMSDSMNSSYAGFFSDDEKAVAEILLDLPDLVSDCERRRFPSVCWRNKRKRSVLKDSDTTTTSSSPACVQSENERCVLNVKRLKSKNVDTAVFPAAAATSPCTTLAFPSSESDEHKSSKQSNSKKRDILNMRSKHFKLSNTNKELKAKKEELSFGHRTEKKLKLGMNEGCIEHYEYQMTEISGNFKDPYGQRTPMGTPPHSGLRLVNETCFLGASSQPLDLNRLLMRFNADEARRTRMMKIKEAKNQRTSQSQHLQCSLTYSFIEID